MAELKITQEEIIKSIEKFAQCKNIVRDHFGEEIKSETAWVK